MLSVPDVDYRIADIYVILGFKIQTTTQVFRSGFDKNIVGHYLNDLLRIQTKNLIV